MPRAWIAILCTVLSFAALLVGPDAASAATGAQPDQLPPPRACTSATFSGSASNMEFFLNCYGVPYQVVHYTSPSVAAATPRPDQVPPPDSNCYWVQGRISEICQAPDEPETIFCAQLYNSGIYPNGCGPLLTYSNSNASGLWNVVKETFSIRELEACGDGIERNSLPGLAAGKIILNDVGRAPGIAVCLGVGCLGGTFTASWSD